jgi:exosortase/archaeosortase family protein
VSAAASRALPRTLPIGRFVVAGGLLAAGFALRGAYRSLEAGSAVSVAQAFGATGLRTTGTAKLLVLPDNGRPFYALVTFGCSSLPVLLSFSVLALLAIRGRLRRRMFAAVAAATLLFAVNVVRVAVVATIGAEHGLSAMARVHDWFGTAVTLLGSVLAAVLLYLVAALPVEDSSAPRRPGKRRTRVLRRDRGARDA